MTGIIVGALLILGLVLIVKGGDIFVDAATWIAEKTGIPKFIIGATIVSLATTLPEMMVSFIAASAGQVDMAVGNAVGSVIANLGLILGIGLVFMPGVINRKDYLLKSLLMVAASAVLLVFGIGGSIGPMAQVLLFAIFAVAMADNIWQGKFSETTIGAGVAACPDKEGTVNFSIEADVQAYEENGVLQITAVATGRQKTALFRNIGKLAAGAAAIIFGSQLLVDNGTILAGLAGVPERVVAITIIAIGTSLPEMVTMISAVIKKQSALSIGNIIGANILDLTLILPISSFIAGKALPVSWQFAIADLPVCLIVSLVAVVPTLITKRFARWQGIVLILFYIAYLIFSTLFV